MKIREFMKKSKVFVLICALVVPILSLTDINAADAIDITKQCSLTLTVPSDSVYRTDSNAPDITAKLYRIASVSESRHFTMLDSSYGVDIEALSQDENADWEAAAATAASNTDGKTPAKEAVIDHTTGEGVASGLETGMYLVMMDTLSSTQYEYSFTPYLISLPNNLYYSSQRPEDDEWLYDAESLVKIGAEPRLGNLEIIKDLTEYNSSLGPATFVFTIEGEKGTDRYSNVVSMTFTEAGRQSLIVENIPAGMIVTVTEVYPGSSYELTTAQSQTATIVANGVDVTIASVAFANTYNDGNNGGYGVENQFTYEDGEWQWNQKPVE